MKINPTQNHLFFEFPAFLYRLSVKETKLDTYRLYYAWKAKGDWRVSCQAPIFLYSLECILLIFFLTLLLCVSNGAFHSSISWLNHTSSGLDDLCHVTDQIEAGSTPTVSKQGPIRQACHWGSTWLKAKYGQGVCLGQEHVNCIYKHL